METVTFLITFFLVTLFTLWFLLRPKERPKKFPPGPKPIPIFGNAFQLSEKKYVGAMELGKIYGPVLGLQLGSYWTVIFNKAEDFREVFSKMEYSGRFGYDPFREENVSDDTKGPLMSQGKEWQDIRRFTLKSLRDFGFGKRSLETIIQEETTILLEELRNSAGKPIKTQGLMNVSVLNVIWCLIAGERFKLGDERLKDLLDYVYDVLSNTFKGTKLLSIMFPTVVKIRKTFPLLFPDQNEPLRTKLFGFLQKTIDEHRQTMVVGSPRDFIDTYLEESLKRTDSPTAHFGRPDDDSGLRNTIFDLFGAGSDTTSGTLVWALFLLALHPEPQEEMYQEIRGVVGSRMVLLEDRPKLPITEAVMTEVYRVSSLVPIGSPHSTTEDVHFKEYIIPKNSIILGNRYAVHFDKEIWGDPHNFRPARFLSEDKKTFIRNQNVMPFGVGKRVCLGETLARDEFFIFLTNIVQQLKITMPPHEPTHSLEGLPGIVVTPEPHSILLLERN